MPAGTVVACNLPEVHFGRPSVWTEPCLSNSNSIVFSTGGSVPSTVVSRPLPKIVIGASTFFGSAVGVNPPSPMATMLPAWIRTLTMLASALPATTRMSAATTVTATPRMVLLPIDPA